MKRITRLRRHSWADLFLLAEALVYLAFAALAVALLPFRTVDRLAAQRTRIGPSRIGRATIARAAWAVGAVARRVPFRAKCFEQGLAAAWMLRRRGLSATLHYGAMRDEENLVAHVWVTCGDDDVIGCENKDRFTELVRLGARDRIGRNRSLL